MKKQTAVASALLLIGCSPAWPSERFPAEVEIKRILFSAAEPGLREACEAIVAEITEQAATRVVEVRRGDNGLELVPPAGWNVTPMGDEAAGPDSYRGAFGGCNGGSPLGDLSGALRRPGAFYKIVNGGEGIAIIVPRAKLAGFFYFG